MSEVNKIELQRLFMLLEHQPNVDFESDIHAAGDQITFFLKLKKIKVPEAASDVVDSSHELYWLTRSAIVAAFSALDRLIHALLEESLSDSDFEKVRFRTFQSPEQIDAAFGLLKLHGGFEQLAKKYSSDLMTEAKLRDLLTMFYKRKNSITHLSDRGEGGKTMICDPAFAVECCRVIREIGSSIHSMYFRGRGI